MPVLSDGSAKHVDELRAIVRQEVEADSLRGVACDVGISAMGLRHFLHGGIPRPNTFAKLEMWRRRREVRYDARKAATAASTALDMLVDSLPHQARETARLALLAALIEAHRDCGIADPACIRELTRACLADSETPQPLLKRGPLQPAWREE